MSLVQQNAASSAQIVAETKGRAKFSAKLAETRAKMKPLLTDQ